MTPEIRRLRPAPCWPDRTLESRCRVAVSPGPARARGARSQTTRARQVASPFHASAIIALADETATAAASWELFPIGVFRPELLPLTVQISANVIRKRNLETLVAISEIVQRGRVAPAVSAASGPGTRPGR